VEPVQIGVVFPQTEIGADPVVIRAYASAAEELGYAHILAYDHVLGADPQHYQGWAGPYDIDTTFHEPFVLFGYLAAITSMELVTGIIILPQRQTALVAKQAAEVDILTEGRLRLGVGLGWNAVEYEALGKDFTDRGRRMSEQVALLRRLWTQRSVTFEGRYETVTAAGLAPMPVQRPIPIWFGGTQPAALRRVGRLADGWFPGVGPGPRFDESLAIVRDAAVAAGRDPASIGIDGGAGMSHGLDKAVARVEAWRTLGASHVSVSTMGLNQSGPDPSGPDPSGPTWGGAVGVDRHIAALAELAQAIGLPSRPL
jgi:probable F420-dependent oxidoreductase